MQFGNCSKGKMQFKICQKTRLLTKLIKNFQLILIERQRRNLGSSQSDRNTRKGTLMLFIIALIHILYLSLVLATVSTTGVVQQWFVAFFMNIIAFRPFSNVLIYFAFGKSMRQTCKRVLCCGYFSSNEESATAETR